MHNNRGSSTVLLCKSQGVRGRRLETGAGPARSDGWSGGIGEQWHRRPPAPGCHRPRPEGGWGHARVEGRIQNAGVVVGCVAMGRQRCLQCLLGGLLALALPCAELESAALGGTQQMLCTPCSPSSLQARLHLRLPALLGNRTMRARVVGVGSRSLGRQTKKVCMCVCVGGGGCWPPQRPPPQGKGRSTTQQGQLSSACMSSSAPSSTVHALLRARAAAAWRRGAAAWGAGAGAGGRAGVSGGVLQPPAWCDAPVQVLR